MAKRFVDTPEYKDLDSGYTELTEETKFNNSRHNVDRSTAALVIGITNKGKSIENQIDTAETHLPENQETLARLDDLNLEVSRLKKDFAENLQLPKQNAQRIESLEEDFRKQQHSQPNHDDPIKASSGPEVSAYMAEFRELCDPLGITSVPKKMALEFGKVLGKGTFGTVYKVTLPGQDPTAAKVLFDNIAGDEDEKKRSLDREISTLKMCSSEYIVKLYTVCQVPDLTKSMVLIMELMEDHYERYFARGGNSSGKLTTTTIGILIQIAKGLDHLHSCDPKIIHRDLKARNVLLCNIQAEIPTAKICDFGLARFVDSMESEVTKTKIAGTRYYLAPEIDSKKYNEKVDIFSFGHLMLSAILGKIIEELPNFRVILDEAERRDVFVTQIQDVEIQRAIRRCLSYPDFKSRPSAKDLIKILEAKKANSNGVDSADGDLKEVDYSGID